MSKISKHRVTDGQTDVKTDGHRVIGKTSADIVSWAKNCKQNS